MAADGHFLYHRRPKNFSPPLLLPLNVLQHAMPDAYEEGVRKYESRRELMAAEIPLLDCRWNDAVHCAPVHPRLIYLELVAAGLEPEPAAFFRIPPDAVDAERTVVLDFTSADGVTLDVRSAGWFDPGTYKELEDVPRETKAYYRREIQSGRRPLLFAFIPHVLVAGTLDTSSFEVVEWHRG